MANLEDDEREKDISVKSHIREYAPGKYTTVSSYKRRKPLRK